jgi:transcriptional regulator with XRE-family HTH domain
MKEADYLKKLGENIRTMRINKKMSQVDLAAACNFEKGNMRRIEAGRTNPTVKTLLKIAKTLDVAVADFFKGL